MLRRWDDLTHVLGFGFPKGPKRAHAPLTTMQMSARIQDALDAMLKTRGFTLESELTWSRPHPPIGLDIVGVQTTTRHAPEFLGVWIFVGFRVPFLESILEKICGPLIIAGEEQRYHLASQGLHRAYCDPDRPKRRLPFPLSFTLWNVDFRDGVVQEIEDTIQRYALPIFDRIKTADDLRGFTDMQIYSRAALIVWLGDVEFALRLLDQELQNAKRYRSEMSSRLERLRGAIRSGELQRLIAKAGENGTSIGS